MPFHPSLELSSPQVQAIPIADCGEPLLDATHSGVITCGPPPECPETAPFYRLLRSGVVARLEQAQQYLPAGLRLRVYEGYRYPKIQQMLFDAQWRRMQIAHPTQSAAWCYAQAAQLASPLHTFAEIQRLARRIDNIHIHRPTRAVRRNHRLPGKGAQRRSKHGRLRMTPGSALVWMGDLHPAPLRVEQHLLDFRMPVTLVHTQMQTRRQMLLGLF
jgi:hypothetical protein